MAFKGEAVGEKLKIGVRLLSKQTGRARFCQELFFSISLFFASISPSLLPSLALPLLLLMWTNSGSERAAAHVFNSTTNDKQILVLGEAGGWGGGGRGEVVGGGGFGKQKTRGGINTFHQKNYSHTMRLFE